MKFQFKPNTGASKCYGCVSAFIARPVGAEQDTIICQLLGTQVKPIQECNRFLPHIYAAPPHSMLLTALEIDPERVRGTAGFKTELSEK